MDLGPIKEKITFWKANWKADRKGKREAKLTIDASFLPIVMDAPKVLPDLVAEVERLRGVLLGYERWEADLILSNEAWGHAGESDYPTFTGALWEGLMALQVPRHEALVGVPREGKIVAVEVMPNVVVEVKAQPAVEVGHG